MAPVADYWIRNTNYTIPKNRVSYTFKKRPPSYEIYEGWRPPFTLPLSISFFPIVGSWHSPSLGCRSYTKTLAHTHVHPAVQVTGTAKVHLHQLVGLYFIWIFFWFCLFCLLYKHQLTVLWLKWDLSAIGWAKWVNTIKLVFFPHADEEFIYLEITSLKLLVPCFFFSHPLLSALGRHCFTLRNGSATSQTNGSGTRVHLLQMTHTLAFIVTLKKTQTGLFFSCGSSSVSGKKTSISNISGIWTQVSAAGMRFAPFAINCHTLRAFYLFWGEL